MAGSIPITCPACGNESKGPAEVLGKKVRCKGCGEIFVAARAAGPPAKPRPAAGKVPAGKPPVKPKPGKAAAKQPPAPRDDNLDDDGNPYGVTTLDLTPRCPNCANEMESAEAIICLHCGYNTRTRLQAQTRKIHDTTTGDWFFWLLPGIACLLAVILLIVADVLYCLKIDDLAKDAWYEFISSQGVKMWFVIVSLFFIWLAGKFAVRRLIFNPRPPEYEKKK